MPDGRFSEVIMGRAPVERCILVLLFAALAQLSPVAAQAQSAENVAVIINDNSADSQRVGDYYIRRRSVPSSNIVHIRTSVEETIDWAAYIATIQNPISFALAQRNLQDRVLYIVLTKGVPLRIAGDDGVQGTASSVDSEMTLI